MSAPKVYIVQRPARFNREKKMFEDKFDLSAAFKFGEPVYILGPQRITNHTLSRSLRDVQAALRQFRERDYLLCLGDPLAMVAAALYASESMQGPVNILRWDREAAAYESFTVNPVE